VAKDKKKKRKRVQPAPPKGNTIRPSDEYYANEGRHGAGPSVIQRSIADSKLKKPNQLRPVPTPKAVDPKVAKQSNTIRNSDEYYANDGKATSTAITTGGGLQADASVSQAKMQGDIIVIENANGLKPGMARAIEMVKAGYDDVRVALGNKGLAKHARQEVEMAVTREEIHEDQGRDIKIGLTQAAASGAPSPFAGPDPQEGPRQVSTEAQAIDQVVVGDGTEEPHDGASLSDLEKPPELPTLPPASTVDSSGLDLGDPADFIAGGDDPTEAMPSELPPPPPIVVDEEEAEEEEEDEEYEDDFEETEDEEYEYEESDEEEEEEDEEYEYEEEYEEDDEEEEEDLNGT